MNPYAQAGAARAYAERVAASDPLVYKRHCVEQRQTTMVS